MNIFDYKWGSAVMGAPATVTYSFLTSIPNYYGPASVERNAFAPMSTVQQQAARDAFAMYAAVANITFVEVAAGAPGVGTASINLGTADLPGIAGQAYLPYPGYSGGNDNQVYGDVWIDLDVTNPTPGSSAYKTFIHEIGHAIGMKHPGNYGSGMHPWLADTGHGAEDNRQYTVMSYNTGPTYGMVVDARTPQLFDVATIQFMYGTNTSTNTGNDNYTFTTTTQVRTIWDAGGVDTFDASNQASSVTIRLDAGTFSNIGGTNNIAIAFGALIENAIGGSGDDFLWGNDANNSLTGGAGHDYLNGGDGADTMTGGPGNDTYVVDNKGDIVIEDENQGDNDTVKSWINYKLTPNIESLTLLAPAKGTGNDLDNVITGSSGNDILIGGVGADSLKGEFGIDAASYEGSPEGVNVSLTTLVATGGHAQGDNLYDI